MQLSFLDLKDGKWRPSIYLYLFIFALTFALGLMGTYARLSTLGLSIFWPVNAVDAALFYRLRITRSPGSYLAAYAGLVVQNGLVWGWTMPTFAINLANVVFILVLAETLSRFKDIEQSQEDISAFFHVILACFLASAACALVGAPIAQASAYAKGSLTQALFGWFSQQLFTAVLCLPLLLSLSGKFRPRMPAMAWQSALPLLFLLLSQALSLLIGPFAILMLTLPALTWCAIAYPLWLVQIITLCTGCLLLALGASHLYKVIAVWGHSIGYLLSFLRLCIAAAIFGPLLTAVYAGTIRRLNLRLKQQASRDFLTNALSRYGLSETLKQYASMPEYRSSIVNMMLIDADHFKKINDNFGHVCGDEVLKHIAALISDIVPAPRLVSRIGGEEFVVVCFGYTPPVFYAPGRRGAPDHLRHAVSCMASRPCRSPSASASPMPGSRAKIWKRWSGACFPAPTKTSTRPRRTDATAPCIEPATNPP